MNTQLIILTSGTIYATSGVIDLYNDIPISLNYNIADIKQPQNRNADYSKTITAPGTDNNNQLLSHIYEIGIDRLFNPNKKVEMRVTYNGISVFKGYMRLATIRKLRDSKIEYDLEIRGRLDDLFTNLLNLKLTDLSWTDLDHTYNETNIANSWSAPVGSGYIYPFIDYGYESNINNISVDHLFPAIYIKDVWDRAFTAAGFQYSSTFINSTYFKRLIMPFTGENMRLTLSQIQGREFYASRLTSNQTHIPFASSGTIEYFNNIFNDDTTSPDVDLGGNYNTSNGIYTVPANGYYNFVVNIASDAIATPHGAGQYLNYAVMCLPRLIKNGVDISYGKVFAHTFPVSASSPYTPSDTNPAQTTASGNGYITYSGFCAAGDTFYVDFRAYLLGVRSNTPSNVDYQIRLNTGSYFYARAEPIIKAGDSVTFSNTLPAEMKITDFLLSIIKMHNLYFEYDKDIPNKIYIEPHNDYYNSTIQDWSSKIDVSKDAEIIPMGALNAKRYQFTYKKDGDVLNTIYENNYGEIYAEKRKDIDNDFLKDTDKMEVIFSPTPQYGVTGTNKFYPALYNVDSSMKIVHNKSMNPRILYYGGLKNTTTWYIYTMSAGSITYGQSRTTYPFCGMMDDPDAPTISLDFEAPFQVFYTPNFGATYSNNNLYNKYWSQFIDEITDYNSSIVTAWFWLTPLDIMEVDFRNVYRFLGQNFRLNKIYDYNPSSNSLTKCEFIKVKNGIPFVPINRVIRGALPSGIIRFPSVPVNDNMGKNSAPILGNINQIYGSYNNIAPTTRQVMVQGDYNSIGTDASKISIINSSGCIVAGGLINVSILNSSGVTVTESNTSIVNNVVIFSPSQQTTSGYWTKTGTKIYNNNTAGEVRTNRHTFGNNNGNNPADDRVKINWNSSTDAYIRGVENVPMKLQAYEGAGEVAVTGDGRFYGLALHNNAGSVTGTTNQYVASGTYTPTLTNVSNIIASTEFLNQWTRVGNVVTVSGYVSIESGAGGASYLEMSLPIASDFTNISNLGGSGVGRINSTDHISFNADITDNRAEVIWVHSAADAVNFTYIFSYLIL